jgi:hypothetical protein
METKNLLTIDTGRLSPEEYRKELTAALLIALKKPFLNENTAFEQEETTGYFFLVDLLQRLLGDSGATPELANKQG